MQPPDVHPTIFFLFDFIRNTHRQLTAINLDKLRAGDPEAKSKATDVIGRNGFADLLIHDTTGKLALMTGCSLDDQIDFGPDIKAKVQALVQGWKGYFCFNLEWGFEIRKEKRERGIQPVPNLMLSPLPITVESRRTPK
jgi:hypothetical protein